MIRLPHHAFCRAEGRCVGVHGRLVLRQYKYRTKYQSQATAHLNIVARHSSHHFTERVDYDKELNWIALFISVLVVTAKGRPSPQLLSPAEAKDARFEEERKTRPRATAAWRKSPNRLLPVNLCPYPAPTMLRAR